MKGERNKYWRDSHHRSAFSYARSLTSEYSRSFYVSSLLLPSAKRWATFALYGFCRFADNLIDHPRERGEEEILAELNGLENELKIAYRTGESQHPIVSPFIVAARRHSIPIEYPLDLLKGVGMDILISRYATFEDLYLFCYRVAGVVGLMMTHIAGYSDRSAFQYAEKLGIALQLTNILRDIREDKEMGRIYIPQNELGQYGISESDIISERRSDAMRELILFQVERAHRYYDEAQPGIKMLETDSQFAISSASRIYRGILRKIEKRDYDVFTGRAFVPGRVKLAILLAEAVRTRLDLTAAVRRTP